RSAGRRPRGDGMARGRDPRGPRVRGPPDGRVSRGVAEDPRGYPDAGDAGAGALLRRGGRDAAGAARAVREPGQPRVGPRAPQAVLPQLQLRAASGRHRGRDRPVARPPAQLPARGRVPIPEARDGGAPAGAGDARRADVRLALALERDPGARRAARARRQEGPHAAPAHGCGGPGRRRVPRPARMPGKPRGRPRDSRPPAGAADHRGLSARGDGLPRVEARAKRGARTGEWQGWCGERARAGRATTLLREPRLWIAAERLPMLEAVFPGAKCEPALTVPERDRAKAWTREDAVRELVRGRLE